MKNKIIFLLLLGLTCWQGKAYSQNEVIVNMAPVDGIDITPDNLLNFQVQCNMKRSTIALISGLIVYRNSPMRISFEFSYTLQPGINMIPATIVRPRFTYSSGSLKELFEVYKKLPQGIYEYCVMVKPDHQQSELGQSEFSECVYHKSEDIFLINLIDPENDAKIYEYNPMLSWTVNYPFATQLTYRLRVAEIKKGQNTVAAITRNNPVFEERNVPQTSMVYPIYAKPLVKNQPYAWTVDAYYKDILLGGAEPWKFTIIEDSLLAGVNLDPAYTDITKESGAYNLYAPGMLKLKYNLEELKTDSLKLELLDKNEEPVKLKEYQVLGAVYGDNRFVISFKDHQPLKHLQFYTLLITSETGRVYRIYFRYVNPDLIK